jgi:hypothetical protein
MVREFPADATTDWIDGEVPAESVDREDLGNRKAGCEGAPGIVTAIDFQYVSTAPPTSSVTPLKGVTMFISKVT